MDKPGGIYISFDKNQSGYFDKYRTIIKEQFNRSVSCRIKNGQIEAKFTDKKLAEYLVNTFGKGAANKHIPDHTKRISRENQLALLLGYLDSDGCVYNSKYNGSSIEYVSINQELLEDIQDLCFAVGIVSSITKMRNAKKAFICGRLVNQNECFHLRIGQRGS